MKWSGNSPTGWSASGSGRRPRGFPFPRGLPGGGPRGDGHARRLRGLSPPLPPLALGERLPALPGDLPLRPRPHLRARGEHRPRAGLPPQGQPLLAQKLVVAHVYAHADFFQNNLAFKPIPKDMLAEMAHHAAYVERAMERHGARSVEEFLDLALSLENLIDPHAPYIQRPAQKEEEAPKRLPVRPYLDPYVNPPPAFPKEAEEGASPEPLPRGPPGTSWAFWPATPPSPPGRRGSWRSSGRRASTSPPRPPPRS